MAVIANAFRAPSDSLLASAFYTQYGDAGIAHRCPQEAFDECAVAAYDDSRSRVGIMDVGDAAKP